MRKIYTLFCVSLLFFASCDKLVEVDAPNDQIGTTQVFEDLNTANAALASLYANLRDYSIISGTINGAGALLSIYTDDLDWYSADQNDQNSYWDIYQNQQTETNTVILSLWKEAFTEIYYANSIIYGTENSTSLTEVNKNQIKGEALLIRSLIYFYLEQIFGDTPYTTSLNYEYNRSISKMNSSALLEQLETDLTESASLLKDDYRDSERIYPNRKVAQLLLAKIYLTEYKYIEAGKMADSVLQSSLYEFQPNINEVFHKSGKHILWQLKPEYSGDGTQEVESYYFSNSIPNLCAITQDLANSFEDSDLRKQNWITKVTYNNSSWYRVFKYKIRSSSNTDEYSIIFRLEEAYFIKAEALAKQNRYTEALPYLNATRVRAGLTAFSSLSGDNFNNELLAEMRREFFTEHGHRFLDLKRWGKLSELSTVKSNWADYQQVWPIPQSEILLNYNLKPQNTGY